MQAGEVNPRGHAPTLSVACVPHNPIGAGGLYVIHERPQVLPQGIVDVQAHGSICVQTIGDDGARVEGVGKVGCQPQRLLGRRGHAKQLCSRRPGAPSVVAETPANPHAQRAEAVDVDCPGQLGFLTVPASVLYHEADVAGTVIGRNLGLPLVGYLEAAVAFRRIPEGAERLGAGANGLYVAASSVGIGPVGKDLAGLVDGCRAARVRPVAGALVVGRPHLHVVGRALRKAPDRRRQRRDRRAGHLRPRALRRGRPVAIVVVGDRRTGVGRRRPRHRQARHRRGRHRRRGRLARRFAAHVGHRHRERLRHRLLPLARAARRRHLHHVRVVRPLVLRVLVVGRRLEGQHPRHRPDGEETLVRAARDRVAGDVVARVAVRRHHRAGRGLVLRRVERRIRAERRRRVGVRRAAARVRPGAGALVVGRPYLHLVGRVLRQARQRRRGGRAGVARVAPVAAVARPVLHVVVRERRTRVGRRLPVHAQAGHRRWRHRRRARLARCLGVHVRHRHRDRLRRRLLPLPRAARRRNLHHVRVVRPLVLRVLEVRRRVERQRPGRRPDGEERLIRAAGDRVARDAVIRIGVRRQHRAGHRLVLRRVERCRRAKRRCRVGVRLPAARVRPVAGALVVGRPYLHLIGGVLRQVRQRRRGGRAVVAPVAPAPAVARPVLHVVVRDRRTRVGRRLPVHRKAGHRRRPTPSARPACPVPRCPRRSPSP